MRLSGMNLCSMDRFDGEMQLSPYCTYASTALIPHSNRWSCRTPNRPASRIGGGRRFPASAPSSAQGWGMGLGSSECSRRCYCLWICVTTVDSAWLLISNDTVSPTAIPARSAGSDAVNAIDMLGQLSAAIGS